MNNKVKSSNKQASSNTADKNNSNTNVTYQDDRSRTTLDGTSNNPFYTPPGEGPEPRITSN